MCITFSRQWDSTDKNEVLGRIKANVQAESPPFPVGTPSLVQGHHAAAEKVGQ